jgi:hypothetical protein
MGYPKVFDGKVWTAVPPEDGAAHSVLPVSPAPDGDGSIFVSLVSYRGKLERSSFMCVV